MGVGVEVGVTVCQLNWRWSTSKGWKIVEGNALALTTIAQFIIANMTPH